MARFSEYLDQYPTALPGQIYGVPDLEPATNRGSFFERFLALQSNPQGAIMKSMYFPERLKQFMAMGG